MCRYPISRGGKSNLKLCVHWMRLSRDENGMALFSSQKILQNFLDSPSHRIFRHMHEVLNIDKNKN